jgi:4-diphosphocytidyl-2-C-methyl-D-erythritol kinase
MATRVRSYSKINLGLAIGPVRGDGFHGLTTLYQTLDLHDVVTVSARTLEAGSATRISLTTNHPWVPVDGRNTAWRMVERCLERLGVAAEVEIHIEKNLPVQGGLGAGSANAAAALLGLERELGVALPGVERLRLAGEVGSDVPLFLLGGAVMGLGRGELVAPIPDLPRTWCVVAVPAVGVSTPQAFRDWDALVQGTGIREQGTENRVQGAGEESRVTRGTSGAKAHLTQDASGTAEAVPLTEREAEAGRGIERSGGAGLTGRGNFDRLTELSFAYASLSSPSGVSFGRKTGDDKFGASGIVREPIPESPEKQRDGNPTAMNDLAENALLALVRTGIGNDGLHNDFEDVVFPQYPSLRITKRQLMGSDSDSPAIYAALSGSGSALFGLYRSEADARAAQQRVQNSGTASGVKAFVTTTLPREEYWARMFAG